MFVLPSNSNFFHFLLKQQTSKSPHSHSINITSSLGRVFPGILPAMKRGREDAEIESTVDMANCLMLLSKVGEGEVTESSPKGRLFACKTCNRTFPSFQALGGHRASHKKPKLLGSDFFRLPNSPPKPKTHECSICGVEFPIGQALGGHMRRHRTNTTTSDELGTRPLLPPAPVLTKSPSSKRVHCLDLDLDLVPEIDLELKLGKVTPALKCFV